MGNIFSKILNYETPLNYCKGSISRSTCRTIPLFFIIFFIVTLFCYAPLHPLTKKCLGCLNYILSGEYYVPPQSSLMDSATVGLIIALPLSIWLGVRKYQGKRFFSDYREDPDFQNVVTEITTKNYLWIPTPEEVESGIVSLQEYQLRVLTCNEMKKNGREFRFLSTNELPPEDRAAILGNASGITPEKSPEIKPPEPKPIPPETKELR